MQTNICSKHTGINKKKIRFVKYPDIPSAIKPVQHCNEIPIPITSSNLNTSSDSSDENGDLNDSSKMYTSKKYVIIYTSTIE